MIEVLVMGVGLTLGQATDDALKRAVEAEAHVLIETSTLVQNGKLTEERILTKYRTYVDKYTVKEEKHIDGQVYLSVLVQLDPQELKRTIENPSKDPTIEVDGALLASTLTTERLNAEAQEREYKFAHRNDVSPKRVIEDYNLRKKYPIRVTKFTYGCYDVSRHYDHPSGPIYSAQAFLVYYDLATLPFDLRTWLYGLNKTMVCLQIVFENSTGGAIHTVPTVYSFAELYDMFENHEPLTVSKEDGPSDSVWPEVCRVSIQWRQPNFFERLLGYY